MSDRGGRRARTERVVKKRLGETKAICGKPMSWRPAGSARKKHPLDCGNTRCGTCHPHKCSRKGEDKTWKKELKSHV